MRLLVASKPLPFHDECSCLSGWLVAALVPPCSFDKLLLSGTPGFVVRLLFGLLCLNAVSQNPGRRCKELPPYCRFFAASSAAAFWGLCRWIPLLTADCPSRWYSAHAAACLLANSCIRCISANIVAMCINSKWLGSNTSGINRPLARILASGKVDVSISCWFCCMIASCNKLENCVG